MAENKNEPKLLVAKKVNAAHGTYEILVDQRGLHAYLSGSGMSATNCLQDLIDVLAQAEISFGIQEEALLDIIKAGQRGEHVRQALVAEGIAVTPGVDAHIDFAKQPTGKPVVIKSEDGERIDYREVKRFDNVRNGDLLATLVPPVAGVPGRDIYDAVITPPTPKELSVEAGDGVRVDGAQFYAMSYGHVLYERGRISVSPIFEVKRDVDMSEGNIRFVGSVEIRGDVRDEFEVRADEDINIGGTAEACHLVAEGNISIHGGVTGKGKGLIELKGNLSSRFLNEVEVICDGDVVIEKEIVNCRVLALGRVIIERGSIMGGEVVALKGILARTAGSDLGVRTSLVVGLHYRLYETLQGVNRRLLELNEKLQLRLAQMGKALMSAKKEASLSQEQLRKLSDSMATIREMHHERMHLDAKAGAMFNTFEDNSISCVSVIRDMHAGVEVIAGKYERSFQTDVSGPLSVEPDPDQAKLQLLTGILLQKYWNQDEGDTGPDETKTIDIGDEPAAPKIEALAQGWTFEKVEALYLELNPGGVDGEGRVVVVAEDQPNMRMLIAKALEKRGFTAVTAVDGVDALKKIVRNKPACCVLDIVMPKMSGLDVLEAVRKDARFSHIPALICSAHKSRDEVLMAHRLGAQGYIVKPFEMDDLICKIATLAATQPAPADPLEEDLLKAESSQESTSSSPEGDA